MRKALLIVPAGLVLAGVAVLVVRPGAAVPEDTFVAGVAVGGMSDSRLRAALDGPVRERLEQPVRMDGVEIRPAEVGIRFDAGATRRLVGRSWLRWPKSPRRDIRPVLDVSPTAAAVLEEKLAGLRQEPKNRSVRLAAPATVLDGKGDLSYEPSRRGITVTEGAPGRAVDTAAGVRDLEAAVLAGRTTVPVKVTAIAAGDDTPRLAGVDQLIGTFTTYHPCCAPRVTNIHRIAGLVDGTIVAPGATFSLNDTAGERTRSRGFVAAPAIVDGELEDQFGGGVSQFSTTLFNAAWFAGLDIRRHQPHSLYIGRYPPGREATLDWRSIDQVIRNDTEAPFVIRARTTKTSVTVGIYGHTGDRRVDSVTGPRRPRENGGFAVRVRRIVNQDGAVRGTDTLNWTYQGLD